MNIWCSGGETAEKQMTFAKLKSKSSTPSRAAGVAIRMSEHAWRCRRPCRAAVCKPAFTCCLSGGHERPWAAILWISFQSFFAAVVVFVQTLCVSPTQSWGLQITTVFALKCFHFIRTKDHWGCISLWCNPAPEAEGPVFHRWNMKTKHENHLCHPEHCARKLKGTPQPPGGQRTSEFKEERTEERVDSQWSCKKKMFWN